MVVEIEEYAEGFTIYLSGHEITFGIEGEWDEPIENWVMEWFQVRIEGRVWDENENLERTLYTLPHIREILLESPVTIWRWNDFT